MLFRVQGDDSEGSGLEELEAPEMEEGFLVENSDTNVFSSILSLTTVNVECKLDCAIEYLYFFLEFLYGI